MTEVNIVYWILLLIFVHGSLLFVALVLYGLYTLGIAIVSMVRRYIGTYSTASYTTKRVDEIRAIGRKARHDMQDIYNAYLSQVTR